MRLTPLAVHIAGATPAHRTMPRRARGALISSLQMMVGIAIGIAIGAELVYLAHSL